jgi:hypothetical protein
LYIPCFVASKAKDRMKNKKLIATIIRWIARVWGSLSLVFMLFVVGGIYGSITGTGKAFGHPSMSFLFFPVSVIIGLGVAWKWEGIGGLITTAGMICFILPIGDYPKG